MQVHADDLITFLQLARQEDGEMENKYELSLMTATQGSVATGKKAADKTQTQLNKVQSINNPSISLLCTLTPSYPHTLTQVIQLTGFSDPVYAEAYININQYDIVLDVLVVNQTGDTLQVLTLSSLIHF